MIRSRIEEIARQSVALGIVTFHEKPIRLKSRVLSPMYIDCGKILGHVELRDLLLESYSKELEKFRRQSREMGRGELVISGVATNAIPISAMIANQLHLEYCYLRPDKKDHGARGNITGVDVNRRLVLVCEDVVFFGTSSVPCIQLVQEAGGEVEKISSIFSYDFGHSKAKFEELGVEHHALISFDLLLREMDRQFSPEQMAVIGDWHDAPCAWTKKMEQQFPELLEA